MAPVGTGSTTDALLLRRCGNTKYLDI
jgi:hypothetical protein